MNTFNAGKDPISRLGQDDAQQGESPPESYLHGDQPLGELACGYLEALLRGERHVASQAILRSVSDGIPVKEIYLHVFQPVQYEVGRLWQLHRISVAQEHYCTAATQLIMSQLYPHIFASDKHHQTLVATCVSGDLHEIGVRMVADFFEMDGWNTFYLGANTPSDSVVETLVGRKANLLGISATIPRHVTQVETLVQQVRSFPECQHVRILVGGDPFRRDPDLWRRIGADGWAADAEEAVETGNRLVRRGLHE